MREEGIKRFLSAVGVKWSDMRTARKWVNCPCVMAQWMHSSGTDERPSFGVSISNDGPSTFYCFGCHAKATRLEGLLHNIFIMSGEYPWDAAEIFLREENHRSGEPAFEVPDVWSDVRIPPEPLPVSVTSLFPVLQWLDSDPAIACRKYLLGRGIPEWVQNLYQVRFDPKRSCLVFPMTDISGRIFILRERAITKKMMWTVSPAIVGLESEFPKLSEVGVWFGMHMVKWSQPVILVEGEIDLLRLVALGQNNVIASATSSVTDAQLDALSSTTLFLGYDSDLAGSHAHSKIIKYIGERAVLFELKWDLVGKKDAGELRTKKELEEVMKGAVTVR